MATKADFQRELSTPSITSADPSASVRALQLQGDMVKGVLSAGSTIYTQYKEGQLKDLETEGGELMSEALTRKKKAEQAAGELSLFAPTLEMKQQEVRDLANVQALDRYADNPVLQTVEAARGRAAGELKDYVDTAARLKEASEQGMTPTEYFTRVQALTKKAMSQFPGMSKEIRKTIGEATGMPYADQWAARQYISDMYTKPKQEDPSKLIEMDHKAIFENTGVAMTDVLRLYNNDPAEYRRLLNEASSVRGLEAIAKQSKARADALSSSQGPEVVLGLQALGNAAAAQSLVDFTKFQAVNAPLFASLANKVNTGALDNIDQTHTELQLISAQATSLINKNFRSSEVELENKYAGGSLNKVDYDKGLDLLTKQKKRALEQFEPANMTTVAKILVAHKDKSVADRQKIMSTTLEVLKLFGPIELITAWMGNAEDSAQRQDIKKNYPPLANMLTAIDPLLTGQYGGGINVMNQAALVRVADTLDNARNNPSATPQQPAAPGVTAEIKKAALEAVALEGDLVLKKLQKNPTAEVSTQDANLLGTLLNNSVTYNQPVEVIYKGTDKVRGIFSRLNAADQDAIKASVSANHSVTSTKVIQGTEQINKMFKTQLQIGYRPSSGVVDIVPPMNLLQSISLSRPTGGSSADDLGPFASLPELKYKAIIPGKEEEFRKYVEATKLWTNTQRTRVNNMVMSKAIVTGEPTNKIGGEIARYLEDKKEIPSFYTSAPVKPPEVTNASSPAPAATSNVPASATGATLVMNAQGQAMIPPEVQEQRDRAAVETASLNEGTPEQKAKYIKELETALKDTPYPEAKSILRRELKLIRGE